MQGMAPAVRGCLFDYKGLSFNYADHWFNDREISFNHEDMSFACKDMSFSCSAPDPGSRELGCQLCERGMSLLSLHENLRVWI